MRALTLTLWLLISPMACAAMAAGGETMPAPELHPVVEIEEDVYSYEPADNGAAPMWCFGSTCLVRVGDDVFASGLETLKQFKPLNNCRWMLFKRMPNGWELQQADTVHRTREPCPIAGYPDGRLFVSANPGLVSGPDASGGSPARPEILQFAASNPQASYETLLPEWQGEPAFREHSYRTFAADGPNRELILFHNIGCTHAEWAFRDKGGNWAAQGQLEWPARKDPPEVSPYKSERARCNYPNVVLKNRAVHFCGAAAFDVWARVHSVDDKDKMGRQWGNRWRRLYYTWTPDITKESFREWVEIASTHDTGGWLFAGDMWVGPDGTVNIVWYEGPINRRLRDNHFPDIRVKWAYKFAQVRDGKVVRRGTLLEGGDGLCSEILGATGNPRVQITPNNRTFLFYYVGGRDSAGKRVCENRLMELRSDGTTGKPIRVPLERPFASCFTATQRGGSPRSNMLDVLGPRAGIKNTIGYARIRLW